MRNNAIVSLAILKVNFDEKKDYLQTFVPMVAETIRCSENDIVSVRDVQKDVLQTFGLNIPQNAIKSILKKVRKANYIYTENKMYKRNNDKLKELDFRAVQHEMLKKERAVISSLREYCEKEFEVKWSDEEAQNAFQNYIEENQIFKLNHAIMSKSENNKNNTKYYVGLFIQELIDSKDYLLEYIEDVIKGMMISTTLYVKDAGRVKENFRNTAVYLDTTFVIYALGYGGKGKEDPCKELLNMLHDSGAKVRCFKHTLDEIKGVLKGCAEKISKNDFQSSYSPSKEYFITEGKSSSDILLLISTLERNMSALNIKIVDTPTYNKKSYIDQVKLKECLMSRLSYRNEKAAERDVESISAVMKLRQGREYSIIEDCRALFVTTNSKLVRVVKDYLNKEIDEGVAPIMMDYILTSLLWLKRPMEMPDAPKKKVIADCFAATQPDERLWNKYIEEIEKLKDKNEIDYKDCCYFKYDSMFKEIVMEVTLGNEETICEGTIKEIIALSRKRIQDEANRKVEEQLLDANAKIKNNEEIIDSQIKRMEKYAEDKARLYSKCLSVVLIIIVLIALTFTLPMIGFDKLNLGFKFIIIASIVIFSGISLVGSINGTTINKITGYFEKKIYNIVISKLNSNNIEPEVAITEEEAK